MGLFLRRRLSVPATGSAASLPVLVERAGGAARFAWDEFFYAEHHNPHTQKAYMRAVRRFVDWAEGEGVELAAITPKMVGQYLVGLGGSAAKRNLHLSALRGFFDRLVNRHVCILNPAASVKGVKDQVIEGKTPEITIEQARTLLASIDHRRIWSACVTGRSWPRWPIPPAGPGRWPSCGWAISSMKGSNMCCGFRKKAARAGKSRCGTTWKALYWPMSRRRASPVRPRIRRCFGMGNGRTKKLSGTAMTSKRICELVKRRLKDAGLPSRLSPHSFRVTAITDLLTPGDSAGGCAVSGRARGAANDGAL